MAADELLHGGVANAGAVVRRGRFVLRPAPPNVATIHALLRHLRANGFDGAPEPCGIEPDGRERLAFIPGDVPVPPFPAWSQTDAALASTALLLRRFHQAAADFVPPRDGSWSEEMSDPEGGDLICHNDVCPENVVYRDGVAVGLLDFDFAAPGRPLYDLAQMARMCVPLDADAEAALLRTGPFAPARRLRIVADAYGLPPGRDEFLEVIAGTIARGGEFVAAKVAAGHPAFIAMWEQMGGQARFDRRREWFVANRGELAAALG